MTRHQIGGLNFNVRLGEFDVFSASRFHSNQSNIPYTLHGSISQGPGSLKWYVRNTHAQTVRDRSREVRRHTLRVTIVGPRAHQQEIGQIDCGTQGAGRREFCDYIVGHLTDS